MSSFFPYKATYFIIFPVSLSRRNLYKFLKLPLRGAFAIFEGVYYNVCISNHPERLLMDIRVVTIIAAEALFAYLLLIKANLLETRPRMAIAAFLICAAVILRLYVFDYETADYRDFLSRWVAYFRSYGGFSALKESIGNYNIPYLYFLALFSYSTIFDLYLIKLLSVFFDILLAYSSCRIVGLFTKGTQRSFAAFFAVLLLPTVFLNGALWGQCDSIYVSLAMLSIWFVLSDRPVWGMVFITLSFGFKLQAVFIMPVFAVFLFQGKIKWYHLFIFPLTYLVLILPAVIAGRPIIETVALYADQAGSAGLGLNYNSPSIFALWIRTANLNTDKMSLWGIIVSFLYLFILLASAFVFRKRLTGKAFLIICALIVLGIPFFLPHMHDRYFYPADVMTLILAFIMPISSICAVAVEFASYLGYYAYLKTRYLLLMRSGAMFNILSLIILIVLFIRELINNPEQA